ncbi:MAG: DegT/DnrJ/EryC1/StrS family aminotransferase [Pyrinomonadaceae bacterium]
MEKIENKIDVPFSRPFLTDEEIAEVVDTLRSGWLTTGPKVKLFEEKFAEAVNAPYAVALNSCTAALHLAVEALDLQAGQAVLIPAMTFAATAEIIIHKNAIPILVDCDAVTGNIDLADARRKIEDARAGRLSPIVKSDAEIVGIIPVYVGGYMLDVDELKSFAGEFGLWIIEDAAHAFPSAWRRNAESSWQFCGENTSTVTCFSFYANKTITTGEGGMAVTANRFIAEKIRRLSLHGLSRDAWNRNTKTGSWDYRIIEPGYKYNLTDIAASIGIHQLARADEMRRQREKVAETYLRELSNIEELELPPDDENRIHSWHLFQLRLNISKMSITRNNFIEDLKKSGVGCSVHWRPLHLHPFYAEKLGWQENHLPAATKLWTRLISLPIFPSMSSEELTHVVETVKRICMNSSEKKLPLAA